MLESIIKYAELFTRECTFMSHMANRVSIKSFINGLSFEWKLSLGNYKEHLQFCLEVLDIPNGVLGLTQLHNWNSITINIDPYTFSEEIINVKHDLLQHLSKYLNIENTFENRVLIFTIKCK